MESTTLTDAGNFSARGKASNLNWEVDAFEKTLRSAGVLQFGDKIILETTGEMNKFNVLPTTSSFMTGVWKFSGDLNELRTWNGNMRVSDFEIRNNKFTYQTKTPFELTANNGVFNLTPFKLGDKDSNVAIKGHTDADQNLSFVMNGKMPIALLTLLPLKLNRAEGLADVNISWTGKLTAPVLDGTFHAKNAYVQTTLFPHALEDLELDADIDQNRIKVRTIKGKMADGLIDARGDLYLPTTQEEARIFLNGTVDQAWLRFPEWLPVLISGNFILDGNLSKPLLKGDFTILEGVYKDEWDWKKQILTIGKAARTSRIYRKEDEGLQYDLSFRSTNGKFVLRNQIAGATLRGDLRVMGTNENVGILGQIEILEGEVVFLDRRFKLTPGVVNFTNPNEVAMSFDLNATINIENIDIFLDIRTEGDEIRAYLSSNPVKEETTIISLLTLGVELNDLAVAQNSDQGMSLSLLPSVLSGPVQSRVETGLRKIKLIDTFQFIPYFSEATKTTSMRLLVGKQLYSKTRLSYSTDLFDTGLDNIFALEQLLNSNVKLMGSVRDNRLEAEQDYDVGFDVEFRLDF
ncbi:MAG: translocation/assembly module TamB domain-containing protein [Bdellovibrionota bacterium]